MDVFGPVRGEPSLVPFEPDFTFRVLNFKSIASVQLPLARLTVLAGSNSSGKSSLLQAALFLAQSVKAKACVINGDLVSLGAPKDVLRDGADELTIEVRFRQRLSNDEAPKNVVFGVSLREEKGGLRAHSMRLLVDEELKVEAQNDSCPSDLDQLLLEREVPLPIAEPERFNLPPDSFLTAIGLEPGRLIYRASENELRASFNELAKSSMAGYVLNDLVFGELKAGQSIPSDVLSRIRDLRFAKPKRKNRGLSQPDIDLLFPFYLEQVAPSGWASEGITLSPLGEQSTPYRQAALAFGRGEHSRVTPAIAHITQAGKRMQRFAASVVYLGPLREDPRVAYPLGHTISQLPVGAKGEFTAAYLESHKGKSVTYKNPDQQTSRDRILDAASKWSRYLGIADEVGVSSRGKLGHELSLMLDGHERDPTAVGVGASQLLPVVVTVLGAATGQLVLLEQPELHLHPRVQSRLADFFAWARPDIRLLIETHSEYLVTRLRLRIADGTVNRKNLSVLFVSLHRQDQETVAPSAPREPFSEFKELQVNELGDFNQWPDGFFDSLDQDAVALAHAVTAKLNARKASAE